MLRTSGVLGLVVVGVAAFAGLCHAAEAGRPLTIGVSTLGLRFPYAAALSRGEHKAAAEAGDVKVVELDADVELLKQANDVDKLIGMKVDGMVVVAMDSAAAAEWADKAKAAGIPMVSDGVWIGDADEHAVPWVHPSLLASADRDDGEQAYELGRRVVAEHPGGAKIAVIEGLPGSASVIFRNNGFERALRESGKPFDIVFRQPANWDPEVASAVCQNAISAHPDLDVIFAQDSVMAQGCFSNLNGADAKLRVYAIDSAYEALNLVRDGKPLVLTCSLPELNGHNAMKTLIDYLRSGVAPKERFVTYKWFIVDKGNVDSCPSQF